MPVLMQASYSLPRWRLTRWLAHPGEDVPEGIYLALVRSLFGTLPIFLGGVFNTLIISLVCAVRLGTTPFVIWLVIEAVICFSRLGVLIWSNRAAAAGRATPTDLHLFLSLCWAASVGYGAFMGLISGDWVVATMTCLSAAAMVGGICFRNFGAPRHVCAMIILSLGPCCPGAALSGEPIMWVAFLQIPMYAFAMTRAAFHLNRNLIATMRSERETARMARRDTLTGLLNRSGLAAISIAQPQRSQSLQHRLAVFYLDLDLFKAVNDRHGHAAGDIVLCGVADRLRRVLRHSDHAARIGGDEFVAIVEDIEEADARRLADRLVEEIAGEPFVLACGNTARLGVSVGLAFAEAGENIRSLDDLLASADRALYEAKAGGRSQYRIVRKSDRWAAA